MKLGQIASVTALVLSSAIAAPAYATWGHNSGWHNGCGTGGNTGDGCHASDYFANDLMYSLASEGITNAVVDGVTISASAYSDTAGKGWYGYDYTKTSHGVLEDNIVKSASMANYGSGYGVINADRNQGEYHDPQHSVDNKNLDWYSNGWTVVDTDYDFVLISFDEEVNVTGATFSWLWEDNDTQVSVAALSDTSLLTSGANTWGEIASSALAKGSFDVLNCDDTDLAQISGMDNIFSQYWIIGAYNTVFGDIGHKMFDDGFKLASIGFNKKGGGEPPAEVTEPGTFAMLFMGGALVMWRRKRSA